MDYFSILNFNKEPFSNSPDPEFFYHSQQHLDCLQKLELSLLLRRGLNVIIGDVGTGKTTLCRQLIRRFAHKKEMETYLILDPLFLYASEFLVAVVKLLTGKKPPAGTQDWQIKEYIKKYLFRKGVDEGKTTILIVDEGQKIPAFCLEILREFLNFETNEYKLLQIVIFAQSEFEKTLRKYPNFADRISLYHRLKPFGFSDTRQMIKYRLKKSSKSDLKLNLFTSPALWAIFRFTGGYPRKIINLCHHSVLTMIIQNRSRSNYFLVRKCARRIFREKSRRWKILIPIAATGAAAALILTTFLPLDRFKMGASREIHEAKTENFSHPNLEIKDRIPEAETLSLDDRMVADRFSGPRRLKTDVPIVAPEFSAEAGETEKIEKDVPILASISMADQKFPPEDPMVTPVNPVDQESPQEVPMTASVKPADQELPEEVSMIAPENPANSEPGDQLVSPPFHASILGRITLKPGETLSRIIRQVYGGFNSDYLKSFISVNPDIQNPDRVAVGQIISLPAIPVEVLSGDRPLWRIKVDETDTLKAAFEILRNHPGSFPRVKLIPYWNTEAGLKFAIVLDKIFKDAQSAKAEQDVLPAALSSGSTILSHWAKKTVFFANPYSDQATGIVRDKN